MGTLARAGFGMAIGGVSLALLFSAAGILNEAWQDRVGAASKTKQPRERAYSVTVATLQPETVSPIITAYGHLESGRTLELRAAVGGKLVSLSENFRDGGVVAAGDVLFAIDPARLETAVALAETDVAEAEATLAEAASALELARLEAEASKEQLDLRQQAATRQEGLRERGVATEADLEAATLARAAANQTLLNRQQVVAGDEARLAQAAITLRRKTIALDEARRDLAEAVHRAPFAGVVSDVTAIEGRLVSANEQLGALIDTGELEVAFRVTNNQYARLLNDQGQLRKADVEVLVPRGRATTVLPAKLDRAGAERDEGQIGRLVYARLVDPDPNFVQQGDFVTLRIPERPLDGVARIPATAVTTDGKILLIGESNRLEDHQAQLLRHQGDTVIVGDVPFGRQFVTIRALQLGPGIMVTPVEPKPEGAAAASAPPPAPEPDMIALDDTRRAAIVAFIEASDQMKPEKREQWLAELAQPEVPRATVERFEAKIAESQ
ncbi:efflux RND transporter periplasmic adaptor subunit [Aliiruegeria sabulilitoris]|uniref:efflux RND transporter periplasmic adaptor subunit n=1 Tax=Aliiruegeria sabulilitoris TaxID=1510458 RepID=UPI0008337328|nr:HlyD family efflux transporter periplasmic adaptor subunit [Aliiruegeria sabulilitoris]NDR55210.1 HlyD family efflux transporter periplasmic adaptor subunit [Pseudoruegeria sp. M32A2M]